MRFEKVYEGWNAGRLTQEEAARVLGVCERSFRRYLVRYEAEGLEGLLDRRLERSSSRSAPVDEVMAMQESYFAPFLCFGDPDVLGHLFGFASDVLADVERQMVTHAGERSDVDHLFPEACRIVAPLELGKLFDFVEQIMKPPYSFIRRLGDSEDVRRVHAENGATGFDRGYDGRGGAVGWFGHGRTPVQRVDLCLLRC
jgi:hypothetical protein